MFRNFMVQVFSSQVALVVKNSPANAGDRSILGWGRSSGGGHGNPFQYLAWRIAWTEESGRFIVRGVTKESGLNEGT